MSETDLDSIAEKVADRMPRQSALSRFASFLIPVLALLWAICSVSAVPWARWVTDSIYSLSPQSARYTATDAEVAHAKLREQIRGELFEEIRGIRNAQEKQTEMLIQMNLKLARRGLE